MAFAVEKPATWTLNSGHAKAPTHLWMLDEASGTSAADAGTGTALNMTVQNAAQWASDALGACLTVNLTSSYYAISATGSVWDASGGLLLVSIFKTDAATGPATTECWFGTYNSASTVGDIRIVNTTTSDSVNAAANADDASNVARTCSEDIYDQNWHMVAVKFRTGTATECCAISVDGGAWQLDAADTLGAAVTLNRYAIGTRARSAINGTANGQVLAAWAYEGGTYTSWDDAWIASLYADPWQFLNTSELTNKQIQFHKRPNTLLRM